MSALTTEQLGTGRSAAREVIAGLTNDGSALTVARAAVDAAMSRRCGVRFVQVVSPGLDAEARAEVDAATFQAALNALRGHPRLRCTFEVVSGSPERTLVDRSRRATVLVVGDDAAGTDGSVAAYCQEHAACAVQVVPTDG
jgi:D-serine deaminase-like pyridoxal phosphate-dependent protein